MNRKKIMFCYSHARIDYLINILFTICSRVNKFSLCRFTINKLLNRKKVSGIGIGIGHYGIEYRRYSKQSIGIGIGHRGIVPSLVIILIQYNFRTINNEA